MRMKLFGKLFRGRDAPSNSTAGSGYAAPRYEKAVNGTGGNPGTGKKSVETVAKEVLSGKWGNGENRKKRLQAAGYDYPAV